MTSADYIEDDNVYVRQARAAAAPSTPSALNSIMSGFRASPRQPEPPPMTVEEIQASLSRREEYPWPNVPELYRTWGRPDAAVLESAVEGLGRASKRLRVLTLTGPVGVGKSTQACKLAAWIRCSRIVQASHQSPWDTKTIGYYLCLRMGWVTEAQLEELIAFPILVMDDLSGNLTLAGLEKSQQVIEERIAARRITIITTTMSIQDLSAREIEVNSGRELGLSSRLAGGAVVTLTGEDRRLTLGEDAKMRQQADP